MKNTVFSKIQNFLNFSIKVLANFHMEVVITECNWALSKQYILHKWIFLCFFFEELIVLTNVSVLDNKTFLLSTLIEAELYKHVFWIVK